MSVDSQRGQSQRIGSDGPSWKMVVYIELEQAEWPTAQEFAARMDGVVA